MIGARLPDEEQELWESEAQPEIPQLGRGGPLF